MRTILFITFLSVFVHSAFAQNEKVRVFLKNGSTFSGNIMEPDTLDVFKLKSGKNVLVFPQSDIDTVLFRKIQKTNTLVEVPWFFKVGGGVLPGNAENEESAPQFFHGSFNYGLTGNFFAGGGTGVEYYMEQTFIPVFANFEFKFRQTRFSPHLFLKTGYLFPGEVQQPSDLYDDNDSRNLPPKYLKGSGGIMLNPGFGFTSMFGPNLGFSIAAGYRHHTLNYSGKDKYELQQRYNRISLSFGLIFK
jgi:sRNA-binding regulator protein Hfq